MKPAGGCIADKEVGNMREEEKCELRTEDDCGDNKEVETQASAASNHEG